MDRRIFLEATCPCPRARVPARLAWGLVEYLSLHRTRVTYSYAAGHVVVEFLHMDADAAQFLLDDWANQERAQALPEGGPQPGIARDRPPVPLRS